MTEPILDTLSQRLVRLERDNRRLKATGAVAMIILAGVMLLGQAGPAKVVEAEKFVVRDANGTIRAELFGATDGAAELHLADKDGIHRLSVHVNPDDSAGVAILDKDGKTVRGEMRLKAGDRMHLALADKDENPRIWLEAKPDGSSSMALMDERGKARAAMAGPMAPQN